MGEDYDTHTHTLWGAQNDRSDPVTSLVSAYGLWKAKMPFYPSECKDQQGKDDRGVIGGHMTQCLPDLPAHLDFCFHPGLRLPCQA